MSPFDAYGMCTKNLLVACHQMTAISFHAAAKLACRSKMLPHLLIEAVHDVNPGHLHLVHGAVLHLVFIAKLLAVVRRLEHAHPHGQALAGSLGEQPSSKAARVLAGLILKCKACQASY